MTTNVSSMLKYLPFVGLIYAIYEAYGARGVSGFLQDLKALPGIVNNETARNQLITGVIILVAGSMLVMKFAPRGWVKYLALTGVYFFGVQQIALAIKSGAGGYAGAGTGRRMAPPAGERRR